MPATGMMERSEAPAGPAVPEEAETGVAEAGIAAAAAAGEEAELQMRPSCCLHSQTMSITLFSMQCTNAC